MFLFILTLATYYAIHSAMAATIVKNWIFQFPIWKRYYRLFYNLLAIVFILPVVYTYSRFKKEPLWQSFWLNQTFGVLFLLLGIWLLFEAMRSYSVKEFIGLDQFQRDTNTPPILQTQGLNRLVRHPLYFAIVVFTIGAVLTFPNTGTLSCAMLTFLYLVLGIRWEEKKLTLQFGKAYTDYQKQVPKLLPLLSFFKKRTTSIKSNTKKHSFTTNGTDIFKK
jgi:protein-S-isoprenylcysteine O-methyltransferase Ste14